MRSTNKQRKHTTRPYIRIRVYLYGWVQTTHSILRFGLCAFVRSSANVIRNRQLPVHRTWMHHLGRCVSAPVKGPQNMSRRVYLSSNPCTVSGETSAKLSQIVFHTEVTSKYCSNYSTERRKEDRPTSLPENFHIRIRTAKKGVFPGTVSRRKQDVRAGQPDDVHSQLWV